MVITQNLISLKKYGVMLKRKITHTLYHTVHRISEFMKKNIQTVTAEQVVSIYVLGYVFSKRIWTV